MQMQKCDQPGPDVRIEGEHETPNGWLYTMQVDWSDDGSSDHELTLSWVDHEFLVGGGVSPSAVAMAAARVAASHLGADSMPDRFDVSILRRLIPGFDDLVRTGCSP